MNFPNMESWNQRGLWVLIFFLIFQSCYGFHLSESYPIYYTDELWVKVNHVNPLISNDIEIPFSFYTLPFCEPHGIVEHNDDSLGKIITGNRVENSPYKFQVYTNESDIFLCMVESLSRDKFNLLKKSIDNMYQVNLILDNLPAIGFTQKEGKFLRRTGYPIGFKIQDVYYIFNHLKFNVLVQKYEEVESFKKPGYMVVGFEVIPCNVKHNANFVKDLKMYSKYPSHVKCDPAMVAMPIKERQSIVFTYEVIFEESDINWVSRWDAYLKVEGANVNWFVIFYFLMGYTFFVGIVLLLFVWWVRKDFAQCERLDKEAEAQMKWRLVMADVFRTPSNPSLLCVMVGTGVQILGMAMISLMLVALGFVSSISHRTLIMGMLLFYMILSVAAGYIASRLWRTFNQKGWISIALKTTLFFSFSFLMLTFLHFILWGFPDSVSLNFIPILVWFCISGPLTLVGGYFGAQTPFIKIPVQIDAYPPSNIPHQQNFPWGCVCIGGFISFAIIHIELICGMPILKMSPVYYVIGFLLVFLIQLVVSCVEVSLVLTYIYLCLEDWTWWWGSFYPSIYVFFNFSILFMSFSNFEQKSLSNHVLVIGIVILWTGYSLFIALATMLAASTVGFFSSFWFVYYLHDSYMLEQMKSQHNGCNGQKGMIK